LQEGTHRHHNGNEFRFRNGWNDEGGVPFQCQDCPWKFSQKSRLTRHRISHPGSKSFPCRICSKTSPRSGCIWNDAPPIGHSNVHPVQCQWTGEVIYGDTWKHTEAKTHHCTQRDSKFKSYEALKLHSVVHLTETPFRCTDWEKQFKSKHLLNLHFRRHTDVSQWSFKCPPCEKRYVTNSEFKIHVYKGTREKG